MSARPVVCCIIRSIPPRLCVAHVGRRVRPPRVFKKTSEYDALNSSRIYVASWVGDEELKFAMALETSATAQARREERRHLD